LSPTETPPIPQRLSYRAPGAIEADGPALFGLRKGVDLLGKGRLTALPIHALEAPHFDAQTDGPAHAGLSTESAPILTVLARAAV
jgi:hypothetical protein